MKGGLLSRGKKSGLWPPGKQALPLVSSLCKGPGRGVEHSFPMSGLFILFVHITTNKGGLPLAIGHDGSSLLVTQGQTLSPSPPSCVPHCFFQAGGPRYQLALRDVTLRW